MVLEKTFESSLDCKKIKAINPKGNQPWIFTGMTDADTNFQCFGHLMWRTDSLEKTLMLGKIEGKRSGWQRVRWLDNTDLRDMSLSKLWEIVEGQGSRRAAIHVVAKSRTWLNNWTTTKCIYIRATLSIRPTPSFPVSKNLFSASASLFLPCK